MPECQTSEWIEKLEVYNYDWQIAQQLEKFWINTQLKCTGPWDRYYSLSYWNRGDLDYISFHMDSLDQGVNAVRKEMYYRLFQEQAMKAGLIPERFKQYLSNMIEWLNEESDKEITSQFRSMISDTDRKRRNHFRVLTWRAEYDHERGELIKLSRAKLRDSIKEQKASLNSNNELNGYLEKNGFSLQTIEKQYDSFDGDTTYTSNKLIYQHQHWAEIFFYIRDYWNGRIDFDEEVVHLSGLNYHNINKKGEYVPVRDDQIRSWIFNFTWFRKFMSQRGFN